jgi:hypothetical protein
MLIRHEDNKRGIAAYLNGADETASSRANGVNEVYNLVHIDSFLYFSELLRFKLYFGLSVVLLFFWVLEPCRLVGRCQRFRGPYSTTFKP